MQGRQSTVVDVAAAAAIEDVIADLGSLLQCRSPERAHPDSVIMGGAASRVAQRDFAGEDLRRELLGFLPGRLFARTIEVAIAGERELTAPTAGALIDHGANGMTIIPHAQPVKHHFGNCLLAGAAFAAAS